MKTYRIAFGCDPNATEMKEHLIKVCEELGHTAIDLGSEDPIYANVAFDVADAIVSGKAERGVLICGTGIGMTIAANKVKGIYAALLTDAYSAERASKSNAANIACMGAFTIGLRLGETLLRVWLDSEFDEKSASKPKVQRIRDFEK